MRDTPAGCGLPAAAAAALEAAGLDRAGVLSATAYDALVPTPWRCEAVLAPARSVVVLASTGRALESALGWGAGHRTGRHPVDDFVQDRVEAVADRMTAGGVATRALFDWQASPGQGRAAPGDSGFADFVALARRAGLGEPGRLRLLLHPEAGPWMAVRALLLTGLALSPTPPTEDFAPCVDCSAPCASACPGDALGSGPLDVARCQETRSHVAACEASCAARRACVIGPASAYSPELEAHFMRSSLARVGTPRRKAQLRD